MKLIKVKNFELVENGAIKYLTFDMAEIGAENAPILINGKFRFDDRSIVSNEISIAFTGLNFEPNYIAAIDGGQVVWSIAAKKAG